MESEFRKEINKFKKWTQFLNENVNQDILHINRDMLFDYNNFTFITGVKVKPYSYPDMDEDLKYVSTYIKGKSKNINNIRILMTGVNTGNKYFMFLKEDLGRSFLEYIDLSYVKEITKGHYKYKSYNYYLLREDSNDVNIILSKWLENNPKPFWSSGYKIADIDNYTYIFNYNGNKY